MRFLNFGIINEFLNKIIYYDCKSPGLWESFPFKNKCHVGRDLKIKDLNYLILAKLVN